MIKRKELQKKSLAAVMAASMTMSLLPGTVLADSTNGVIADGTYESTAHVTRTAEDDEDENAWDEYDVNVKITVADGKFSDIAVTPGTGYNTENASYFNKAASKSKGFKTKLLGQEATVANIENWDTVSTATRTSTAVRNAALEAVKKATPAAVDTAALEKAIADAEALNEADYTADSWKAVQTALTEAKSALSAKESQSAVDTAKDTLNTAVKGLVNAPAPTAIPTATPTATPTAIPTETPSEQVSYVLMNIPYDKFYAADVNNAVPVDVFSSATKNKTRTSSLAGGSYHSNADGSAINGITFPVKVTGVDLSKFKKVTDSDSVSITVTKRGQTSTQTYTGKNALFENTDYAYYVLSEAPAYYKEATVNADGSLSFGKTVGTATELTNVSPEFMTKSGYGDYQLDLDGLEKTIDVGSDQIYGVIVSTKEGNDYGMRHVENIWRGTELAWSTGFTTQVHGCPTSSAHYKSMMGQHINKVTYYTSKGIYTIPVNDIFVPTKFEASVSVENASLSDGKTTMTVTGLPDDYDAEYSVEGLDGFAVDGNTISFSENAKKGMYTLTIRDKKGVYADLQQNFTLYTDAMPAAYNGKGSAPALVKAEDASEEDFADYIKNITSVKVNGKEYAATGKRKTVLIKEDGTLDLTAAAFAEGTTFEIEVTATGYKTFSFTYEKKEAEYKYVYAGLSWAEYWAAEGVQAAGSDAGSEEKDGHDENDKGAFDTVTRATTNHGLHRGSFQCAATIYMKDGTTYDVAYYTGVTTAVLTNGETVTYDKKQIDHYEVKGLKYVPVKVSEDDYEDFCKKYVVVENGGKLSGGFTENKLQNYTDLTAEVTADTNGLKTAVKNADGTFSFSARTTGTGSGIAGTALKTAPDAETVGLTVKDANGSYGEFLRVDLNGDYGDLAANLQTVTWTYYGDDSTYTNAKATYGTKFAADNWMHKVMGIQLGLTDSQRCTLPEGTDGTGYWKITIHALGYADASYTFEATKANIVGADPVQSTAALEEAIAKADALKEADYTAESWASMQMELAEAKEALEKKQSQGTVDEATEHLNAAIEALVKKEVTYKYVYAGLTWSEYWKNEGVYQAGSTEQSDEADAKGEYDKGAFDTVTRATTNHGLHRGSYQCNATITMKDGTQYQVAYYTDRTTVVLTNGQTVTYDAKDIDHYEVYGLKYVPVKVAEDDYEAFCQKYAVVENGGTLNGGFSEGKLSSYVGLVADVTENTNGLKTATKNEDGSFSFSARTAGSESGIKDQVLKTAPDAETVGLTVKDANGSYGEFLRVDLNGDYSDLAANLQTVTWTYYGDDATYTNAKATYGTKFAADNWMHKAMGIQLGLTDSVRCQLPEGTNGTGYWKITIHALGYADASYTFEATKANIVGADPVQSTAALEEAIAKAEALNEADYTAESWASMQTELSEAKEELEAKHTQAAVDEATEHLNAAIEALVKASTDTPTPTPTETPTVTPTETPTVTPTETPTVTPTETPTVTPTTTPTTAPTTTPTTQPTKTPTSTPKATSTPLASSNVSNTSTSKKSDNAKTGDVTNIWGWVSMAVASLGAGGLGLKLRGRKKNEDEE